MAKKLVDTFIKLGRNTLLKEAVEPFLPTVGVTKILSRQGSNQPPSWYYQNYAQSEVLEFKDGVSIGSSANYGVLRTIVAWYDTSIPIQQILTAVSVSDGTRHEWQRSGTTSWTVWKKII